MDRFIDTYTPGASTRAVTPEQLPLLADLIERVEALIKKFVLLRDPALATVIACWAALTYLFERFYYCGYLSVQSAPPDLARADCCG